jgi:hypothetical protein
MLWETPVGAVNGNNKIFTASGTLLGHQLIADRVVQEEGLDYTVALNVITFLAAAFPSSPTPGAPPAGTVLRLFKFEQAAPVDAAGDIAICNRALLRCGSSVKITSFAQLTKEARVCGALYAPMRDKLLEMYDWKFARTRKVLVTSSSAVRNGWLASYDLPADCLAPRRIWNGEVRSRPEDEIPFETESNDLGTGQILLCNVESTTTDPELIYTRGIVDPTLFSNLFADALAWLLADELVVPLTVSPTASAALDGKFEKAFALGVAMDSRQAMDVPRPESEFIQARFRRPFYPRPPRIP